MKPVILTALYLGTSFAQHGAHNPQLPNPPSKAEREAIAKEEYNKNVADAATLLQLAEQLKVDIDKQATQTVSATTLKEVEQIEKLAHAIRNRLKR